jgi:putative transcriptional regulator
MNLEFDFFDIKNDKKATQGCVLISEPFLNDTYFKRSVVYLTEHTDKDSVGFVLNKPIDLKVQDVLHDFPVIETGISIGGPVSTNTVHYIHTLGSRLPNSVHVQDEIFWGGDFDVLKELIQNNEVNKDQIRFFLGYSGWTENQLESELSDNAWLVAEISPKLIMKGVKESFWKEVLEKMSNKYKVWANFPENPGLN